MADMIDPKMFDLRWLSGKVLSLHVSGMDEIQIAEELDIIIESVGPLIEYGRATREYLRFLDVEKEMR